jgi:serine protease SohB
MDTLWSLVDFLGKSILVFATFAACTAFLFSRARRRREAGAFVRLRDVGARWRRNHEALSRELLPARDQKRADKDREAREKQERERGGPDRRVFVLDFKGDVLATAVESLREEVTAILALARDGDEVVVRLESPGGTVHGYGLAASQLSRIRARGLPLTACIDRVAASGGYMMACVAPRVIAAPFAIVGSIGVVASVPNLHRALERWGVDYEDVTAGRYKRTVSLLGPIKEEGRAKLQEQIEETHGLFKSFVARMRPALDIEAVATGEHWYGTRAVELGLVDAIGTSDDCLVEKAKEARVLEVTCDRPVSPRERVLHAVESLVARFG